MENGKNLQSGNGVLLVQALYPFTGKNNDELCFKKGDLIVVTQKEEGGWWEGTFNENTGWFPSNYVKEQKISEGGSGGGGAEAGGALLADVESPPLSPQQAQQQVVYRTVVSKEIVESEKTHVAELKNINAKYLIPLLASDILTEAEFKQMTGNLEEVILFHSTLLSLLEEQLELPAKEQRIGGTFLKIAPTLQAAHKAYIGNHPKAVCVIEKHKEELNSFMECQGAARPGTLVLTTALSQPFRRLDKYPGVLQEFQRHIEESHPDRGDTQRSTHVFRELTTACSSIRRQKQLELEVLTNKVHGWEGGESLSVLGDIVHMRSVALLPDNRDRYLVLFPSCLIILALSSRASSFIFEGKYPLSAVSVNKLEDGSQYKNAFEITGSHVNQIIAVCQSPSDQQQWVEILHQHIQNARTSTPGSHKSSSAYSSPPAPPAHHSPDRPILCAGRPYALLTKYFAQFYRRKAITKELLRALVGIPLYDPTEASKAVVLRAHRSECSIWLSSSAGVKGSESDDGSSSSRPPKTALCRRRQREDREAGLMSPQLRRKEYRMLEKRNRSNLQKWKFRPLLLDKAGVGGPESTPCLQRISSSSSSSSTNNPYGYIHYFSSEASDSSSDSWGSPERESPTKPPSIPEEGVAQLGWRGADRLGWKGAKRGLPHSIVLESKSDLTHSSSFRSLPPLSSSSRSRGPVPLEGRMPASLAHVASTLDIPAPTIVIPFHSDDERSSTPNVCNRTIYGLSSDEVASASPIGSIPPRLTPAAAGFHQPIASTSLAYYFSLCSVDNERSSNDFYAEQRRHVPLLPHLSRSEPNLHYPLGGWPLPVSPPSPEPPRYETHFVRVLKRVEAREKECSCESHSLHSSDSGLADVTPHGDGCPLLGETPIGLGRASLTYRLSRGSLRIGRRRSSSLIRAATPDFAYERDSLFHTPTPCCTPCTSAPLSCVSDSSVSLLEAATLASPTSTGTYRSGLYAHWWMKASVSLKPSKGARSATVLSDIAERPELPLPSFASKPSRHPLRGSRRRGRVGTFLPEDIPIIQRPDESPNEDIDSTEPADGGGEREVSSRSCLELEDAALCRDPSFESQASQATVILRTEVRLAEFGCPSKPGWSRAPLELLTSQTSLRVGEAPLSDISSMHSFYESEEGAGESSLWRDPSEGLLLDFKRKSSLQSDLGSSLSRRSSSFALTDVSPDDNALYISSRLPDYAVDLPWFKADHPEESYVRIGPSALHRSKSLPKSLGLSTPKGSPLPLPPHNSPAVHSNGKINAKPWSLSCLRPSPPLRPGFSVREEKRNLNKPRRKDESWHEDDALILRVIEHYCTSAKTRYTVNSIDLGQVGRSYSSGSGGHSSPLPSCLASTPTSPPLSPFGDMRMLKGGHSNWCCGLAMKAIKKNIDLDCLIDNPQLIIADEEKIIVEETRGNQVVIEEKSLVDTVYALKDQLSSMAQNYQELRNEFEVERKRMQSLKKLIDQWLPLIRDLKASTNL